MSKWQTFCSISETNCFDFSETDVHRYVAWLSLPGRGRSGRPLKYKTVVKYLGVLRRAWALDNGTGAPNPCESRAVTYLLQAVRRVLMDTTQRARPLTLEDLRRIVRSFAGVSQRMRAARFGALILFWGALRLGSLTPSGKGDDFERLCWDDIEVLRDGTGATGLRVVFRYSKTNQFQQRRHIVVIAAIPMEPALCPVRAFLEARPADPHSPVLSGWTFETFVTALAQAVLAVEDTPHTKGRVTGHSFRRGFVRLATELGMDTPTIMLHGDWKDPRSVKHYAEGAAVATDLVQRVYGHHRRG